MVQKDQLKQLLSALTSNEKRYICIYLKKEKGETNILHLMDLLETEEANNESWLAKKLSITKSALANLKYQTYHTILKFMRLYNEGCNVDYQIREWTLNAYFLFERRLYDLSLKELENAIELADSHDRLALLSDLLAFQAEITIERNPANMQQATTAIHENIERTILELQNELEMKKVRERSFIVLRSQFQIRNSEFEEELNNLFNRLSSTNTSKRLSYQHHLLYAEANRHLCFNRFEHAIVAYKKLLELWEKNKNRIEFDSLSYTKLLSNYSTSLFSAGKFDEIGPVIKKMRTITTRSLEEQAELFQNTYYLELLTLMNTDGYEYLDQLVSEIEKKLTQFKTKINKARELSFYHNIAMAYFLVHDWKKSKEWLDRIIAQEKTEHRQDLQCTARMLRLPLMYEFGKHDLMEYELINVERFLRKRKAWFSYESTVVKFFGKLIVTDESQKKILIEKFKIKLKEAMEGKTSSSLPGSSELLYWAQSKLSGKTMRELLREESD